MKLCCPAEVDMEEEARKEGAPGEVEVEEDPEGRLSPREVEGEQEAAVFIDWNI
jgi:hypothetical protein